MAEFLEKYINSREQEKIAEEQMHKDLNNLIDSLGDNFLKIKDNDEIINTTTLFLSFEQTFKNHQYSLIFRHIRKYFIGRAEEKLIGTGGGALRAIMSQKLKDEIIMNELRKYDKNEFKKLIEPLFSPKKFDKTYNYNLYYSYNTKVFEKYCKDDSIKYSLQRQKKRGEGPLSDREVKNAIDREKKEKGGTIKEQITNQKIELQKGINDKIKERASIVKKGKELSDYAINMIAEYCKVDGKISKDALKDIAIKIYGRDYKDSIDIILKGFEQKGITRDDVLDIFNNKGRSLVGVHKININSFIHLGAQITTAPALQVIENNKNIKLFNNMVHGEPSDKKCKDLFKKYYYFEAIVELFGNTLKQESSLDGGAIKNLKYIMERALIKYKISQSEMYNRVVYRDNTTNADIMLYAISIGNIEINNLQDLEEFRKTIQGENTKYTDNYNKFLVKMEEQEDQFIAKWVTESLTARYKVAAEVAEGRNFYESEMLQIFKSSDDKQNQSGVEIVSNISGIDKKFLNKRDYTCKPNRTEHEEAALKYTAFDITFKNTFNLTNPIIEKLAVQQVDLRSDLFKYNIYNQNTNTFNQSARDKYVAEKLKPIGLVSEEIEELGNAMTRLPVEVENNYYILSGKFVTVQDNFEKIAKIYALGEIIDNIRNLFKNNEIFSGNAKLGDVMGFEFDESEPADIVGDCLLLKGKINGTTTKIKYDLRTGKLYMNSMTQQEFNPPKITIGNDEPNTEIGDLGNFSDLLEGYQPTLFTQADKVDYSKPSNENATVDENGGLNRQEANNSENKDSNQKTLERLMENKLLEKLAIIGNTVKEKAGEQSKENNVIDEFLRTFNILPDEGNSDTIEFVGGSTLFTILKGIKNTDNEQELTGFSFEMGKLMELCEFKWGKNSPEPRKNNFNSIAISDIAKEDIDNVEGYEDIISLQDASQTFFASENGGNDKSNKCHFDASYQLSFANIIVEKCGKTVGGIRSVSADNTRKFVEKVSNEIKDIKDKKALAAAESIIEDDSIWT